MELAELTRISRSPLRRLNPLTKLALASSIAVLAVTIDNVSSLELVCFASLFLYALSRPNRTRIKLTLLLLGLAVWGTIVSQALFYGGYPRTPIAVVVSPDTPILGWLTGGVYVYLEGVEYGLRQSLRLVASILAGLAVAWTTDPKDLLLALSGLRISRALALSTTIALRFLPIFVSDAGSTLTVLRLRGLMLTRDRPSTLLKYASRFLTPLYASLVRRARTLSVAIESRGYGGRRALLRSPLSLSRLDYVVIGVCAAVTGTIVVLKLLFVAYATGAYYNPALVHIYSLARKYL